jgi:hypothetical protein
MSAAPLSKSTMDDSQPTYRLQKAELAWLVAYLATIALIVGLVVHVRARMLESLGTPEAQVEWDAWRRAADEQSQSGPVRRAKSESPEPPTLVLLRDYFGIMLTAAIVFSSLLFATAMIAIRGAYGAGRKPPRVVNRQPWNS